MFDELQLDAEWSLNVGNWLWLSGSTFIKEHVSWFCPVEVGKKIDPTGEYVRYVGSWCHFATLQCLVL